MTQQHAILSPSSASRWLACPAAPRMEQGRPDEASPFAAEGSAAHEAAARALIAGSDVGAGLAPALDAADIHAIQSYVDYVQALANMPGAKLFIEEALDIQEFTGEKDAIGTADAVILLPDEVVIIDFKFGRGVRVDAEENPQLMLYACAALRQFGDAIPDGCDAVRLVVHQARIGHVSECRTTRAALDAFADYVERYATVALDVLHSSEPPTLADFAPGEAQCRFCRARSVCPALAAKVQREVGADFEQLAAAPREQVLEFVPGAASVARALPAVPLIEAWCRAVTAEAERLLMTGEAVAGYKLVRGRQGARAWGDAAAAESLMRSMKLPVDEMYERKLISPTTAEKLRKRAVIGPRQWTKLQALITRSEGKPCIAPETDPRPAISVASLHAEAAAEFEPITA